MKTEIERVCEIMETLLAHQPIIDVPYDKINDIAIALVKEGYGDVKQAQIDVLNRVMTYINNKIENDYGDMSDSAKYLTINIYDFDDFIDELIKEVQNGEDKS